MDDLAAAAAVLAMTVESESDDGLELEDCRGCSSDNMSAQPEMEISDVDKENLNHFPMDQRIGAEVPKVMASVCGLNFSHSASTTGRLGGGCVPKCAWSPVSLAPSHVSSTAPWHTEAVLCAVIRTKVH